MGSLTPVSTPGGMLTRPSSVKKTESSAFVLGTTTTQNAC